MAPDFLTVEDVTARLQISRRQVYRLMDDGAIASVNIGGLRRIPARAFERYLSALEADALSDQRARRASIDAGILGERCGKEHHDDAGTYGTTASAGG